jgi:class 3 adenylate cyclase
MARGECIACGHLNRDGARFCSGCGAALASRCASCGAELPQGDRFCDSCGAPVPGADLIETVEGARKTVSVVFSDLAGSTAMQEALDPESVRRVMARYYEVMRTTVERHGGSVGKFIGDAVVAVFGTPAVREDDALRAVRCAGAMTTALHQLNDDSSASGACAWRCAPASTPASS